MQQIDGRFVYSASDLNNFLECRHLTELERKVALGELVRPERDEQADLIARKGTEHEAGYLEHLLAEHPGGVTRFDDPLEYTDAGLRAAEAITVAAMERGDHIIYQATFYDGEFLGRADFLRRIEVPCERWPWSYEVVDTKLAVNVKSYYLIQLCDYSSHVARIQGTMPEHASIVLGDRSEQRFRLQDFLAYYHHLKERFLENARSAAPTYPLKCSHCAICPWNDQCAQQRADDDHLSLVAWMRRDQIAKFESNGIATLERLAGSADGDRPKGMNPDTFSKLRRQASMQLRGRTEGKPCYELIEHHPAMGLGLLPEPATGDVFFDMEGDPIYEPARGLEYLFGLWLPDDEEQFLAFWGLNRADEKIAFESFIDFIIERRKKYPALHVYHYATYEKTALRRLAQEHSTREDQLDELLRGEVFVDLFAVVRQALVISEPGYGLKRVEHFYDLRRETDVRRGDDSILMFERWREEQSQAILDDIKRYNRDDCRSLELLLKWLLELRKEAAEQRGIEIPFYLKVDGRCHAEYVEECGKCRQRERTEREHAQMTDQEHALLRAEAPEATLLAYLLAYHRREEKPGWWQYFDRCENADELLEFDKEAIGGLTYDGSEPVPEKKSLLFSYDFPEQAHKLEPGDSVADPATRHRTGTIFVLDDDAGKVVLKSTRPLEEMRAIEALIPAGPHDTTTQQHSLARIASAYLNANLVREHPATLRLLQRRPPGGRIQPETIDARSVLSAAQALNGDFLFIQGPPGTGKSTIASQVICDLLRDGKRIGVTANSHKAIHNLLHMVEKCADARGDRFAGLYKCTKDQPQSVYASQLEKPFITSVDDNAAFESGGYDLAGGTAWLFAREQLAKTFDYLFIDEAGQVALADAVAVSAAAKNVVLLGDPVQLAQVSQGRHPERAGQSVLRYLLGDRQTIPPDQGIFLDRSWRMHPDICSFVSEMLYDGRLRSGEDAKQHCVNSSGLSGAGLRYIAVEHAGNSRTSSEEADAIVREAALLLEGTVCDGPAGERPLQPADIIVVTPYNAQRRLIERKLRDAGIGIRVGTVDKFQGQEAAVVFYSLASSSGDDVPRGLDFAFEPNRFNVAISRAKCLSVLLCSPRLLDAPCSSPRQMAMVNLLCAYVERAQLPAPAPFATR